jgi:hypothetical protein
MVVHDDRAPLGLALRLMRIILNNFVIFHRFRAGIKGQRGKKDSASFLKKRSKKHLLLKVPGGFARSVPYSRRFLHAFFQKSPTALRRSQP